MNQQHDSLMSVPINIYDSRHVNGIISKLINAGLVSHSSSHPLEYLERLRGTNTEPLMIVRHPAPNTTSSAGIVREHAVDEAIRLLADPDGPEAQLRQRRKLELAAQAEKERREAEAAQVRAQEERQQRWDSMSESQRALWLVAARTVPKNAIYSDGPIRESQARKMIADAQREFVEGFARALVDAQSPTASDDLINLPQFAA